MFSLMLSIALIFVGLFFFNRGLRHIGSLKEIDTWRPIAIEVIQSEITEDYERGKYGPDTYFLPSITYVYNVNGKRFESDVVFIDRRGIRFATRIEAEGLMRKILGAREGYYNPKNFGESVLVRDIASQLVSHHKALMLSGAILVILGIVCAVTAT